MIDKDMWAYRAALLRDLATSPTFVRRRLYRLRQWRIERLPSQIARMGAESEHYVRHHLMSMRKFELKWADPKKYAALTKEELNDLLVCDGNDFSLLRNAWKKQSGTR